MKKAIWMMGAALALLIVAAVGAFAYGRMDAGSGSGVSPSDVERGAYHEQMEEILESGSYADLEALRAETGRPMMPWVTDEAGFQEWQERHAAIIEENGDLYLDVQQYPKMYFTGEVSSPVQFAGSRSENALDGLDYALLAIVVNEARLPINELARRLESSPTVVRGRLKRLQQLGVIIQFRIEVDLNRLGLELYKAIIRLDRCTQEDERRLLEYCSRLPSIQYYIRNLWQLEPEFVVRNYQEYYRLIEELKRNFPEVVRSVDSVLMITDEWTPGFQNLLRWQP